MKKTIPVIAALLSAIASMSVVMSCTDGTSRSSSQTTYPSDYTVRELRENFKEPPLHSRPLVWWHWMDGNITKDGIRKDIEWFKRAGIGGFHHFDAAMTTPQIVDKRLIYMQDDWKDAFRYAITLADSLGMDVSVASSPGWSCMGGPWVEPKDGMKKVVWRESTAEGGKHVDLTLPEPYSNAGTFLNFPGTERQDVFYEDIAVLAVPIADDDLTPAELGATVKSNAGPLSAEALCDGDYTTLVEIPFSASNEAWIMYSFPEKVKINAVSVADGRSRYQWANAVGDLSTVLECSDDGVNFVEVAKIPSNGVGHSTVAFPTKEARFFRVKIRGGGGGNALMAALGYGGGAQRSVKVPEFRLYTTPRVNHSEEKAGFAAPHDLHDFPNIGEGSFPSPEQVVDLTSSVKDGVLSWDAPEGRWRILRIGYSLTGKHNSPAPAEATGLEVDKMDPIAWKEYFHTYLDMYREATGGLMGEKGILNLLTDSYEAGQENWTPAMAEEFASRRGYSLIPWLPALTGQILVSPEATEKFLWDWRRTMGELVAESYDALTDIVKEYGMKGRFSESHENGRVYIVDGMDVKRTAMVPMGAIWTPSPIAAGSTFDMAKADLREASSVSHIYGQNVAGAESLTAIGMFNQAYSYCPENLKNVVDVEFASGINKIIIHESSHQPRDDKFPGLGLSVTGQWFNRHETWAEYAKPWTDYIARSSYLLQQGHWGADILVYYGEDSNVTAQYGNALPDIPKGYNFDFINPDALLGLLEWNGSSFTTPSGMEYKVLLLGKNTEDMSVQVLRKLDALTEKGAVIVGKAPSRMTSLSDSESEFDTLVGRIWGGGRDNVKSTLEEALKNVPKDFITDADLNVVHRKLSHGDIYWLSNPSSEALTAEVSLNVTGKGAELWNPETGEISVPAYGQSDGRTTVTVDFDPYGSYFIVLSKDIKNKAKEYRPVSYEELLTVQGPWNVEFQKGRGAPDKAEFPTLMSYTDSDIPGIKYFSGTATYSTTFTIDAIPGEGKAMLDLGKVKNIAEVSVNGRVVTVLWKTPFRTDIGEYLKEGENTLQVKVTNLWPNRIIGDAQPDATEKITFTPAAFYNAGSPLSPGGLLGPVKVVLQN